MSVRALTLQTCLPYHQVSLRPCPPIGLFHRTTGITWPSSTIRHGSSPKDGSVVSCRQHANAPSSRSEASITRLAFPASTYFSESRPPFPDLSLLLPAASTRCPREDLNEPLDFCFRLYNYFLVFARLCNIFTSPSSEEQDGNSVFGHQTVISPCFCRLISVDHPNKFLFSKPVGRAISSVHVG